MPFKRKPGPPAKDASITEGFNENKKLTAKEKREIKRQRDMVLAAKRKAKELEALKKLKSEVGGQATRVSAADDDVQSAYQMLEDMRWVYQKVGGRKALQKFIKENSKAYELMVKELMKIESAMKQTEIKQSGGMGGSGSQNVFVVLKGLESEEKQLTVVNASNGQGQIDLRSMSNILKPADALEDNAEIPLDDEDQIRPERG